MKVLLVDDSRTVVSIYTKLLEEHGYEVISASNAQDAFEIAVLETPQIGIIDYFMEDRNGDQLIRQLQRDPRTKEMVCAIFSQHPDIVDKALASGAIDLISKEDSNDIFLLRVNAMRRLVVIWSRQREIAQLVISESNKEESFRILFVDDSATVREVYYNLLTHQGYEVILAADKSSALQQAQQLKPQLAILDFYLPDGTGAELARELRATPGMEDILIWLYTSRTDLNEVQTSNVDVLYKDDPDDILVHRLDSIKRYVIAEHSKRLIEARVQQHQEELQQSTDMLEHVDRERGYFLNLLNTLPLALISIKKDSITYSNRSFRNEFGIDPQEMKVTQLERRLNLNKQLSDAYSNSNSDPCSIRIGEQFYRLSRSGSFTLKGEREEVLISLENISQEDHIYNLQQHQIDVSSRHDGKMERMRFPKTILARMLRHMVNIAIYSILSDEKLCFGGGKISITIKANFDNPNQAQITVIDNGPEHADQQLSTLHTMQSEASHKQDEGHELYLVSGLARNYGGDLMIRRSLSGNGYLSQLLIPRSLHLHKNPQ